MWKLVSLVSKKKSSQSSQQKKSKLSTISVRLIFIISSKRSSLKQKLLSTTQKIQRNSTETKLENSSTNTWKKSCVKTSSKKVVVSMAEKVTKYDLSWQKSDSSLSRTVQVISVVVWHQFSQSLHSVALSTTNSSKVCIQNTSVATCITTTSLLTQSVR